MGRSTGKPHILKRIYSRLTQPRCRYIRGKQPLFVRHLVSPLRYDVLVRKEFFAFLTANHALFHRDFKDFLALAMGHPYFVWFTHARCPLFAPHLLKDKTALTEAFAIQLRTTEKLYQSLLRNDFDTRHPITLMGGTKILRTSTGKQVRSHCYCGDGCHRLAFLLLQGRDVLQPEHYRIKYFREHRPLDITHLLLRPLSLEPQEYYSFLSLNYANRELNSRDALLEHVLAHNPSKITELESILSIDDIERVSAP